MSIKVLKRLPRDEMGCSWCNERPKGPCVKIHEWACCVYLCVSCLQTFRRDIDALSILVQTGIDTKEK